MGYHISAWFVVLWGVLAVITAVVELDDAPSGDFSDFANTVANPEEVTIDQPTVGVGSNPLSTAISYGKLAAGWLIFMGRAAALQSSIWEAWTAPIRYAVMLFSIPFIWGVAKEVMSLFSNFVGGIFGRTSP